MIIISKVVVSTRGTCTSGVQLCSRLRDDYHLESEMCTDDYVTAIATVMDTEVGLNRLGDALIKIDQSVENDYQNVCQEILHPEMWRAQPAVTIHEAWNSQQEQILLKRSAGKIAGEFVYLYPPGIPVIAPGERITDDIINMILRYKEKGLPVQGMKDSRTKYISVLTEGG